MLRFLLFVIFILKIVKTEEFCGISVNINNQQHFPWIAIVKIILNHTTDNNKYICGSTIITNLYAITAAHCIKPKFHSYERHPKDIYLQAVHDLKDVEHADKIFIDLIILHEDWMYREKKYDGDLALLKFKKVLKFNKNILRICLWHKQIENVNSGKILSFTDPKEGDPGYSNITNNYPVLYNMPIRDKCIEIQPKFEEIVSNRTFCGGGLNSGPCLEVGNSGSSMAVEIDGKFYLRGIVSSSFIDFAGCDNYTFSLFTDVLKYQEWIDLKILN